MLFLLICLTYSSELQEGFYDQDLDEGQTNTYELEADNTLFFRLNKQYPNSNLSIYINTSDKAPEILYPQNNIFYQLNGRNVSIHSITGKSTFTLLFLNKQKCDKYVFHLSSNKYLSTNYSIFFQSDKSKLCYIFYEPKCDYYVSVDCQSNKSALCQIFSNGDLIDNLPPSICQSNSTCSKTLSDGFVVSTGGQLDNSEIRADLRVVTLKGENSVVDCSVKSVDEFNSSGIYSNNLTVFYECTPKKEPVLIAVVLVTILILFFITGIIAYNKCVPKRNSYDSDEGAKEKLFSKGHRRNSETGARESTDIYTQMIPE